MNESAWDRDWHKWWHESCDKLGLSYDTSFKDFTLALGDYLYPNGVSFPTNRAERRKLKRKKQYLCMYSIIKNTISCTML